ncbi:MAG TPA: 30S ribosomal protein S8e, partial [Methanocorpusculum sp.]|nr:30S ribosomal protein S8e [Methanocorpusculum sp.]
QGRSVRKYTGGRYHTSRGKKRFEIGRSSADTVIGERRIKIIRVMGGNTKVRALRCDYANVSDIKSKTVKKVKVSSVAENSANQNYARRNLITKGAIIVTEIGKARVVSRPGQDGVINAILIE